jgi:hypothetical protein
MTYMPQIPIWAWNLTGEDTVYFSQPTEAWIPGEGPLRFSPHIAVARCPETEQMGSAGSSRDAPLTDRTAWSYPIQCGMAATLAPDGRHVCAWHLYKRYTCRVCDRYDVNCTGIREFVTCCSDPACLATCTAPPVPCEDCGTLLFWEEQTTGICWDCRHQSDTE